MERWKYALQKAKNSLLLVEVEVKRAAQLLAKSIGFYNYDKFGGRMAADGSTIFVDFYGCGYDLELDIETMSEMSKQQIIDKFKESEECMLVIKDMF